MQREAARKPEQRLYELFEVAATAYRANRNEEAALALAELAKAVFIADQGRISALAYMAMFVVQMNDQRPYEAEAYLSELLFALVEIEGQP